MCPAIFVSCQPDRWSLGGQLAASVWNERVLTLHVKQRIHGGGLAGCGWNILFTTTGLGCRSGAEISYEKVKWNSGKNNSKLFTDSDLGESLMLV